jgi:SAM-dependent methyltransferase
VNVSWGLGSSSRAAFLPFLLSVLEQTGARRVCDIGGGANPVLPLEVLRDRAIECTVLDISPTELAKAPSGYRTHVADVAAPHLDGVGPFDVVFSHMLAEHVADPVAFHANVLRMLRPGGVALHYFPTLYALPFVVNRFLPDRLARAILVRLRPGRFLDDRGEKFPAYYRWCRGPTAAQVRRLEGIGFEVEHYVGLFGTKSYFERIPPLQRIEDGLASKLLRRPLPWMTSYAFLVVRRPGGEDERGRLAGLRYEDVLGRSAA